MRRIHVQFMILLVLTITVLFSPAIFSADGIIKGKIKVFLLAGQSNMDGLGDGGMLTIQDKARLESAQKNVRLAFNRKPIAPLNVTTPPASITNEFNLDYTFGPELFFGIELAEAWPNEQILLIKRSKGGTSLYGRWNPDWSIEKAAVMEEENKSKLYKDFMDYTTEVLSGYKPEDYEICGMLWVQGEQDSGVSKYGPKPAEDYGNNLKNLINAVRNDTGVEDLPFMMLQVGSGKVVEGMQETAMTMQNVSFIPQSMDPESPDYLPSYSPPLGHYNYEGMKRIGTIFADVFLREYAESCIGR